jgi:hypothetical protein
VVFTNSLDVRPVLESVKYTVADVEFYSTSQTALRENGSYVHMTKQGNISLTIFTIQRGSIGRFTETEADLVLQVIKFHIMYQGIVYMTDGTIYSDEGVVSCL